MNRIRYVLLFSILVFPILLLVTPSAVASDSSEIIYVEGQVLRVQQKNGLTVAVGEVRKVEGNPRMVVQVLNESPSTVLFDPKRVELTVNRSGNLRPLRTLSREEWEKKVKTRQAWAAAAAGFAAGMNAYNSASGYGSYYGSGPYGSYSGTVNWYDPVAYQMTLQSQTAMYADLLEGSYKAAMSNVAAKHTLEPGTYYGGSVVFSWLKGGFPKTATVDIADERFTFDLLSRVPPEPALASQTEETPTDDLNTRPQGMDPETGAAEGVVVPGYPREAWALEGEIQVQAQIDELGSVVGTALVSSSGMESVDRAVLDAVYESHFTPVMHGDEPISATISLSFDLPPDWPAPEPEAKAPLAVDEVPHGHFYKGQLYCEEGFEPENGACVEPAASAQDAGATGRKDGRYFVEASFSDEVFYIANRAFRAKKLCHDMKKGDEVTFVGGYPRKACDSVDFKNLRTGKTCRASCE